MLEVMENWKLAGKISERLALLPSKRHPRAPRSRRSLPARPSSWQTLQRINVLLVKAKELLLAEGGENRAMLDEIESMLSACPDPFDFRAVFHSASRR